LRTIGWLNRFLPSPVSIEAVEDALIAVFAAELKLHFLPEEPTTDEWRAARQLAKEKYANDNWTQSSGRNISIQPNSHSRTP
jgi:lipoate-protein ligase A